MRVCVVWNSEIVLWVDIFSFRCGVWRVVVMIVIR